MVDRADQVTHNTGVASTLRAGVPLVAAALFVFAAACYGSYRVDCFHLRAIAELVTAKEPALERRVIRLLRWVHHNERFTGNESYFLLKRLGATPVQVLEGGGDCADKSRLLSAMLREIGIPSTMLMCFDERNGRSTHTVVEARIRDGAYMVVDPAYNMAFPRGDGGGYHGLLALRGDPTILPRRLDELIEQRGRHTPVRSYDRARGAFGAASSINWNKNAVTRMASDLIGVALGDELYRVRRPVVLEEPKLAIAYVALGLSGFSALVSVNLRRSRRRVAGSVLDARGSNERSGVVTRSGPSVPFGSCSQG